MPGVLEYKNIVMGVTGSIACYKALDLASKLTQGHARVDVIMSDGATNFITPLAFRSLTHRPVVTNMFDISSELSIEHVALAEKADIVVVAPATAHCIAKIAHGLADDALTTTVLATQAPLLIAPAMDAHMYANPATQENLAKLVSRGTTIVGPTEGRLASGLVGMGRLSETYDIVGHICATLGNQGDLAGCTVVVTAGGTQEPIDPVRVVTNRSSGKMGYAVAEAARDRGSKVILITSSALQAPAGVEVHRADTAQEMLDEVLKAVPRADALIMAAAVADYRPASFSATKVKKGADTWSIELEATRDILNEARGSIVRVGFAAETDDLQKNALTKLNSKDLDLIVANDVTMTGSSFGSDFNKVLLIGKDEQVESLPTLPKYDVAGKVLDRVRHIIDSKA